MTTTLALMLLLSMAPAVMGNAEEDPHHDHHEEGIAHLKTRLKSLRDYIDTLNSNVCQSGTIASTICDATDEFRKLFKCITAPANSPVNNRVTLEFSREFEAAPVVAAAITGLSGYTFHTRVSPLDVQKDSVELQIKTEDLFAPFGVSTGIFSCPHGLAPGHAHSHGLAHDHAHSH